jgi:uncharacterized protein YutE (UPF0331/DUF86 family)
MSPDRDLIFKHLSEIEAAVAVLEKHRSVTAGDLERSVELRWTIERGLQVVIQNMLDVAAHILASEFKNEWDDYRGLIEKLGVHDVVPSIFAQELKGIAGFRNILVHEYMEVDLAIVEKVLKTQLDTFREFAQYIVQYLDKPKSG